MVGYVNGLLCLCKADQPFPEFCNCHCMIDREQLLCKSLNSDNVMKPVMEIGNYIHVHSLNHRQFRNLSTELDHGLPGHLPLHCTVRWLSKSKVLSRFHDLLHAVKIFMEEKGKYYPQISDLEWVIDLGFLVDMMCHLDRLNLTLQGKFKMLSDLVKSVFAFINKLKLSKVHFEKGELTHFSHSAKSQWASHQCHPEEAKSQICNTG